MKYSYKWRTNYTCMEHSLAKSRAALLSSLKKQFATLNYKRKNDCTSATLSQGSLVKMLCFLRIECLSSIVSAFYNLLRFIVRR